MDEMSLGLSPRDQAAQQAEQALAAFRASSRPTVPRGASVVSALAVGAGVALLGQAFDGWAHAAALLGALALLTVGALIPAGIRSRSGVHGYRGQVRRDNVALLVCGAALLVAGLDATAALGAIYVGLGAVSAIAWFLLLRNRFGAAVEISQ